MTTLLLQDAILMMHRQIVLTPHIMDHVSRFSSGGVGQVMWRLGAAVEVAEVQEGLACGQDCRAAAPTSEKADAKKEGRMETRCPDGV